MQLVMIVYFNLKKQRYDNTSVTTTDRYTVTVPDRFVSIMFAELKFPT